MANSAAVVAGNPTLEAEYNNLRLDVLDPATGHQHDGVAGPSLNTATVVTRLALATTTVVGLQALNSTAAAAGAQQVSPATRWSGRGWKTDATAASQAVEFQAYVLPVEGAAAPTGIWTLQAAINGGAYSNVLTVTSAGVLAATSIQSTPIGSVTPAAGAFTVLSGTSGSHVGLTALGIRDTSAAYDVTVAAASSTTLTAGRVLTVDMVNAARTIKLGGNLTLAGDLITVGAYSLTLTQTATTNVTLPTTGTLSTLAGSETLSAKTLTSPIVTGTIAHSTYRLVAVFSKTGIADNVATAMFTITTPTSKSGFWSCIIHVMSGTTQGGSSWGSNVASQQVIFHRTVAGAAGIGTLSGVTNIASIGPTNVGGSGYDIITSIAVTIAETSEYITAVYITNDNAGNNPNVAYCVMAAELIWHEFDGTAPVLAAA